MPSSFDLVIPRPQLVEPGGDARFAITADTAITVSAGNARATWVANYLAQTYWHCRGATAAARGERRHVAASRDRPCRRRRRARRGRRIRARRRPGRRHDSRARRRRPVLRRPVVSTAAPRLRRIRSGPPGQDPPGDRARRPHRRRAAIRVARRHARRLAPFLHGERGQAIRRSDGALQAEPPAPAPVRRSRLAHRDPQVARSHGARRALRSRRH